MAAGWDGSTCIGFVSGNYGVVCILHGNRTSDKYAILLGILLFISPNIWIDNGSFQNVHTDKESGTGIGVV